MGSCATKNAENEVTVPQNPRLQRAYNQFAQIININHPLNVNLKYNSCFKLIPDQYVGQGMRKTNQYESRLSYEEWVQKKEEFWESRIEGSKENWQVIRAALEADDSNARAMLSAAELRMVNQSMQLIYDAQGQKYDIPVFCLNKPVSFPTKKSYDQNLSQNFPSKIIKVIVQNIVQFKLRCSKWNKDKELEVSNMEKVSTIKQDLIQSEKVAKLRLFYSGKEMHEHHCVGNYNIMDNAVVQVFF